MKHLDIRVRGRVQGVCFRESTRQEAQRLGVAGTVRNEPDGSVFIQAEGDEKPLERLVAWCRTYMLRPDFPLASAPDMDIPVCVEDGPAIVKVLRDHHARWLKAQESKK